MHAYREKEKISLVDYGAGNGLLGIFAKYCGIGEVYISDISPEFVESAENLSRILGISIDGFIKGDIDALDGLEINAIAGTDVIEHIYDLDKFIAQVSRLNPEMISVFTTASNPKNFLKITQLKNLQRKDELIGGNPNDSLLFGSEAHEAFLKMRKDIIHSVAPHLEEKILIKLAEHTRGKNREDILQTVITFLSSGSFPEKIKHPTNTCNPMTGSWTERILELDEYKKIFSGHNFQLRTYNGFYDIDKKGLKKNINVILNYSVCIFGKLTAPFITLVGYPN